ncbi:MAG: hypothetical protein ACKVP4_05190 [Hyphomicrobium sp.]
MPDSEDIQRDQPRLAATDRDFTLTIEEVAERYHTAGHPRTIRTLQRYCASGHLDAQKIATTLGDKYFVAPYSVARHIAQINEVIAFTERTTGRDVSRPAATGVAPQQSHDAPDHTRATDSDEPQHVATGRMDDDVQRANDVAAARVMQRLEDENDFLREQIDRKDKTIDSLIERDRETNILVRGLQEMLTPLLGPIRREPRHDDQQHNVA